MVILAGRMLFSLIFLMSGTMHFMNHDAMTGYAASMGVPMAGVMVWISGMMILLGGMSVVVGYKAKVGAWVLVLFLVPTAFLMHRFWGISDPMMAQNQMAHFMKNLSMAGGALIIAAKGAGACSVDKECTTC